MTTPELAAIALDDEFQFGCHQRVPCFNHCCRDLNQALTPYDVLRLRKHLNIGSREFFLKYAVLYAGPSTGLPVASLRFNLKKEKHCPFVADQGCQVYDDRPSSCRLYPLVRGLQRSRADGAINEHFALLREPHCRGFEQDERQTVRQWISGQGLSEYHRMNDMLMELIALKNQRRPGALSPEHQQLIKLALYDPETLRIKALAESLPGLNHDNTPPMPEAQHREKWLLWGFQWVRQHLFGDTG